MKRFEYWVVGSGVALTKESLNGYGSQGYELVTIVEVSNADNEPGFSYTFKKEITQPT